MKINDLIVLKSILKDTKVGQAMTQDGLRGYLKLSVALNKYANEFDSKRKELALEAIANKGYDVNAITAEQDREIFGIIAPILDEYLGTDVDVNTKILSWDDLFNAILSIPENADMTFDNKTTLTEMLCYEEL